MATEIHMGKLIRNRMNEIPGLSTKTFAERLGVHEQTIYDIFKRSDINTDLLRRVADILEVPISYFFQDIQYNDAETTKSPAVLLANRLNDHHAAPPPPVKTETVVRATPVQTEAAFGSPAAPVVDKFKTTNDLEARLKEANDQIAYLQTQLRDKEFIIKLLCEKFNYKL